MQNISKSNLNSHQSFRYAIISLILFFTTLLISVVTILTHFSSNILSLILGFTVLVIVFLSIVGFIDALKGFKEPKSTKKTIGFIVNSVFLILFLAMMVNNILDMYKAVN